MNYIPPHNINVPHKGSRQTTHFREDAQRMPDVSDRVFQDNWDRAMGRAPSRIVLGDLERQIIEMLYAGPREVVYLSERIPVCNACLNALVEFGLVKVHKGSATITQVGVWWWKEENGIALGYEETDGQLEEAAGEQS